MYLVVREQLGIPRRSHQAYFPTGHISCPTDFISHYITLHYTILYYITLYYIIYYTILHSIPHYITLHHTTLHYTRLYDIVQTYTTMKLSNILRSKDLSDANHPQFEIRFRIQGSHVTTYDTTTANRWRAPKRRHDAETRFRIQGQ
jgi:hypothetical protein